MTPIIWNTKKIKICELKDYENNPRSISKKDFERLVNDIRQDGYHSRLLVDFDNVIIGGHSRKKAILAAGNDKNQTIEVLSPSRKLTEEEFKRINIRDNLPFGDFDFDVLGNCFEQTQLIEWGMPQEWFEMDEEAPTLKESEKLCKKCPYEETRK